MSTCSKCSSPVLAKGLCKKHYRAQPERAAVERAKHKEWLTQNQDYHNEQQAEYRKQYRIDHSKEAVERAAVWAKANPDRVRELKSSWDKAHPEDKKAHTTNRRARLRNADGKHTATEVKTLFTEQNGLCAICRVELKHDYHKDHMIALSRGG